MKSELLEKIRDDLRTRLGRLSHAALEAHAAATDPGSKAEGKYDTRSLEASYLAAGQSRQVESLLAAVRIFEVLSLPDYGSEDEIDAGALVEIELGGERTCYLLVPAAGGSVIHCEGSEITLLSPESPLYGKLVGMRMGEMMESPRLRIVGIS